MSRARLLLALIAILAPGCATLGKIVPFVSSERIGQWCGVYMTGRTYVDVFVRRDIETRARDTDRAFSAVSALALVDSGIVNFCAQHSDGVKVTEADLAAKMAEGTHALAQLVEMHGAALTEPVAVPGERGMRAPVVTGGAPIGTAKLLSDLRRVNAQALESMARRR